MVYGRQWLVGGVWYVADGEQHMVAEIMTSVDILV